MKYLLKKKTEAARSKISFKILLGISFHFPNVGFCWIFILKFPWAFVIFSLLPECFEPTYLQIADHLWIASVHDTLVIAGEALSEILISSS